MEAPGERCEHARTIHRVEHRASGLHLNYRGTKSRLSARTYSSCFPSNASKQVVPQSRQATFSSLERASQSRRINVAGKEEVGITIATN